MELVLAPVKEPITLEEARLFLRAEENAAEDALINNLIKSARFGVESFTGRALITQTWKEVYPTWPKFFLVPKAPLISVSSIKYFDSTGILQTLAADQYRVVISTESPGEIFRGYEVTWPDVYNVPDAITLEFIAGFGTEPADVPEAIRTAMQLSVSHFYDNRGGEELPGAVAAALQPYRVYY